MQVRSRARKRPIHVSFTTCVVHVRRESMEIIFGGQVIFFGTCFHHWPCHAQRLSAGVEREDGAGKKSLSCRAFGKIRPATGDRHDQIETGQTDSATFRPLWHRR
jgi:hypothetical protein